MPQARETGGRGSLASIEALYDARAQIVLFVVLGSTSAEDLIGALEIHYGAHTSDVTIWDCTRADVSEVDVAGLKRVAQVARDRSGARRDPHTILVMPREHGGAVGRLYSELSRLQGPPIRYDVVGSRAEAFALLGIADPFPGSAPETG